MNIKDIFNKLFKTNNSTNIINLNEIIKLPSRRDINSEEIISLIDDYKKEYLSILSTKKYLLPDMLSSKNIQDELKMNMDLIMNLYLSDNNLPDNKIDIITRYLKLKLYLDKINELGNEVLTKLIALTEISKEKVFLSKQKKHRISYEINNLLSIMIMFNSQKYALERECESYFNKLLSLNIDINLTLDEQEQVNKKLQDVHKIASTIPEINTSDYQGILGLVFLERQLEIYVYNHKEDAKTLKEQIEIYTVFGPYKLLEKEEDIKLLELCCRLFNEYGRNLITDEDLLHLYRLKFNVLKIAFYNNDYNINLITEETTDKELKNYKIIIMEIIENIVRDGNGKIKGVFGNNTNKAIKYMIKILKNGGDKFNSDKILYSKFLLSLLLVFSSPEHLNSFFKNYKINPELPASLKFQSKHITDLHERLFDWEESLPLDTIFKIDNINEKISTINSSVSHIMDFSNAKEFDRITYLKKIYLLINNSEYDFVKKYNEYDPWMGEYDSIKEFYLPEGLKCISLAPYRLDSDILFLGILTDDIEGATVYFPKSLLMVKDDIFLGRKVNDIKLNDGLQNIDMTIFVNKNIRSTVIPSSVSYIGKNAAVYFNFDYIYFKDFTESLLLNNPVALKKFFEALTYFNGKIHLILKEIRLFDKNIQEAYLINLSEVEKRTNEMIIKDQRCVPLAKDAIILNYAITVFKELVHEQTGFWLGESRDKTKQKVIKYN